MGAYGARRHPGNGEAHLPVARSRARYCDKACIGLTTGNVVRLLRKVFWVMVSCVSGSVLRFVSICSINSYTPKVPGLPATWRTLAVMPAAAAPTSLPGAVTGVLAGNLRPV